MRRLLAAFLAIVMVVGGFVVRRARNRGDTPARSSVSSPARLGTMWCVPEAAAACATVASDVETMTPAQIESQLTKPGLSAPDLHVEAIVATGSWIERWLPLPIGLRVDANGIASTELVAVEKVGGPGCTGELRCLLMAGPRLALPDLGGSSAGTTAAALAMASKGVTSITDALDPKVVAAGNDVKQSLATPRNPVEALQALLQVNLLDAAVMTRADFDAVSPANASAVTLRPAATVTLHVGLFGPTSQTGLRSRLATALTAEGWTVPTAESGPSTEFLNQTYNTLR